MRGEDKGAEVLGKVYEQYRLGDPITDEQLRIAIPEAIKLEDLLFAMGDRFNLAAREVAQFRNGLEGFHYHRELGKR